MDRFLNKTIRQLRRNLFLTILFLLCMATLLVLVNYYTIKVNASIRAYIHGESMYSKGQKDAARHLTEFVHTPDSSNILLFKKAITIPQGDGQARIALEQKLDDAIVTKHLRQGNNHPDDIDNLIWLFKNFINVPFMQQAYTAWHQADTLIMQLDNLADSIFVLTDINLLDLEAKNNLLEQIERLNNALTIQQLTFSRTLSEAGRKAEIYLFYFNLLIITIILSIATFTIFGMVKRLVLQNAKLKVINKELDRFVYSASHDLRAPIASLKGLTNLIESEKKPEEIKHYIKMMGEILERQDLFLKDIINFTKNKRLINSSKLINSKDIIEQVIANYRFMESAKAINFIQEIELENFIADESRLLIILNNLISNAIKYHDLSKKEPYIKVSLMQKEEKVVLSVSDNGLGIEADYQERIFDMFFVTDHKNKGSGLGLYIVADALEKINGNIKLQSEAGKGSTFTIEFPYKSSVMEEKRFLFKQA